MLLSLDLCSPAQTTFALTEAGLQRPAERLQRCIPSMLKVLTQQLCSGSCALVHMAWCACFAFPVLCASSAMRHCH